MFVNYEDSLQGIILKVSILTITKPGRTFARKYYTALFIILLVPLTSNTQHYTTDVTAPLNL